MSRDTQLSYIAIDGGGSTCRMRLVTPEGRIEHVGGAANMHSDWQAGLATVTVGFDALVAQSGLSSADLCALPCYAGLAGVLSAKDGRDVARDLGLSNALIEEDRRAAVVGALDTADGAVAALGTGSFVARQRDGDVQAIGGHGVILGDEGSAAWIGKTVLARVLHAVDGLCASSRLCDDIIGDFSGAKAGIIAFAQSATPAEFGALAPRVVTAAEQGDPIARGIMTEGAEYIMRALVALGYGAGDPLCLIGGVGPHYAPYLPKQVQASVQPAKGSPLDGAERLAHDLAQRTRT